MARALWTYLFVFDDEVGTLERVMSFIDSRPEIVNWHCYFPNSFFLVSDLTAERLRMLFVDHLTNKKGRFIILDTATDRDGWLPQKAWKLMRGPKSAEDEAKGSNPS